MNETLPKDESFYIALANLFYAIVYADKKIVVQEKRKIVYLVEQTTYEEIQLKQHKELIYSSLRKLIQEQRSADQAFEFFRAFYYEHTSLFSKKMRSEIITMVKAIANAFAGRNKSEVILITKLLILFKIS